MLNQARTKKLPRALKQALRENAKVRMAKAPYMGLDRNRTGFELMCVAHNIKRALSIKQESCAWRKKMSLEINPQAINMAVNPAFLNINVKKER